MAPSLAIIRSRRRGPRSRICCRGREGVLGLDDPRLLQIAPFDAMGTPLQLIKQFGTRADFERAVHDLQATLYQGAA